MSYILEKLFEYLYHEFPTVMLVLIVIALFTYAVWKAAGFYVSAKHRMNKIDAMEAVLDRIDRGFTTLNTLLLEKQVISQSCFSKANSPRVISEAGLKLFTESGASAFYESHKDELLGLLEKKNFDSFLDLEREALQVLLEQRDRPEFTSLQNFVFEHPVYEGMPLTFTDLLFVISLKLRDYYREKHPDATLAEVA